MQCYFLAFSHRDRRHEYDYLNIDAFFNTQEEETTVPSTAALPCSETRRSAASPAHAE